MSAPHSIEARLLGFCDVLDVLMEAVRPAVAEDLNAEVSDALLEIRFYIEDVVAAELDELRDRAAWASLMLEKAPCPPEGHAWTDSVDGVQWCQSCGVARKPEPRTLPPLGPSSIIARMPNPSPTPTNVRDQ